MSEHNGTRKQPEPLGLRFARDLTQRARRARVPRIYLPCGDAMQAAMLAWIAQQDLGAEQRSRLLRHVELLDGAVVELPLALGRFDACIVTVDAAGETTLRELDDLTRVALAKLDARDALDEGDAELLERERVDAEAIAEKLGANLLPALTQRPDEHTRSTASAAARRARSIPVDVVDDNDTDQPEATPIT